MEKIILIALLSSIVTCFSISDNRVSSNMITVQSEGLSINSEVKAFLVNLITTAFIYNGKDPSANAYYITQKLNTSPYSGNWNVIIAINCTYPSGYGAYSYQGSWWAYWSKINPDALDWCYYLTRMPQTTGKYANKTGDSLNIGDGLEQSQIQVLNGLIQKAYSIYKQSQNGNSFYVSQQAGKALGGYWDVLVLNNTSQYYSSSYSIGQKWETLIDITELKRRYFIRKVWNQA